jgi:DNA adenine methylase
MKAILKTPISYYGGKQNLLSVILPIIPPHNLYCEPFVGGAAVFWAKEPSPVEIINDLNGEVVNFYRVMQTDFEALYQKIDATLHSRKLHSDAGVIYAYPHLFSEIDRAWAFWVQCNQSFSSKINSGWAYARKKNSCEKKIDNNKLRFKTVFKERLKYVQIECNNALQVIVSRDCPESFFYVDPPYPESNQGHYAGYTLEHFKNLLDILSQIKGKFLLSSYDYPILTEYANKYCWNQHKKEMLVSATLSSVSGKREKKKVEVFTTNYPIEI